MSAINGGRNFDDHFDIDAGAYVPAAPETPGDEASVADAGASVGATIPMDTGLSHLGRADLSFNSSQNQDLNLIAGMASIDTSESVRVTNDGISGSASAKIDVTVPFARAPSLADSIAAARARSVTTPTSTDTRTSSAGWRSGDFQDQHARGIDVSSAPESGPDSATLGAQTADAAGKGKSLYERNASASASATFWHRADGFDKQTGAGEVTGSYDATLGQVAAGADASVKVTTQGAVATANASASLTVVDATGRLSYTTPSLTLSGVPLDGRVDATVHAVASAEAHANGTVAFEPAAGRFYAGGDVGASAVAKIEGNITATAEYKDDKGVEQSLASATLSGYASAGAEAQAHARIGYDNGNISFDIGAGLAWGLGAGYDLKGSVNVKQIALAAVQGIDHATHGAITKIEDEAEAVKTRVEDEVKDLGEDVKEGVIDAGKSVAKAADAVEDGVENAAHKVGGFFKKIF